MAIDKHTTDAISFILKTEPPELAKQVALKKLSRQFKTLLEPVYKFCESRFIGNPEKIHVKFAQLRQMLAKKGNPKLLSRSFLLILEKGNFDHPYSDLEDAFSMLSKEKREIIEKDDNTYAHRMLEILETIEQAAKKDRDWKFKDENKNLIDELMHIMAGWIYDLMDSVKEFQIIEQRLEESIPLEAPEHTPSFSAPPEMIRVSGGKKGPGANESLPCVDEKNTTWILKTGRINIQLSEYIASKILYMSGLPTPDAELGYNRKTGKVLFLSKALVAASNTDPDEFVTYMPKQVHDGNLKRSLLFMIWLHNRDARLYRNYLQSKGRYYMIDFGGSLLAKPRGSRRKDLLHDIDLKSFLEYLKYFCRSGKFTNQFFAQITYDDLHNAARMLARVHERDIVDIVDYAYKYMQMFKRQHKIFTIFHPILKQSQLVHRLLKRREQLIDIVSEHEKEIEEFLAKPA